MKTKILIWTLPIVVLALFASCSSWWSKSSEKSHTVTLELKKQTKQGLAAPASVSDFDCLFVNVVGPGIESPDGIEDSAIDSTLEALNNGSFCSYLGVASPPVALGGSLSVTLQVPGGVDRIIQVVGVEDSGSNICDNSTSVNSIDGVEFEAFELGRARLDILEDQTVTVENQYDGINASERSERAVICEDGTGNGSQKDAVALSDFSFSYASSSFTSSISSSCSAGTKAISGGFNCGGSNTDRNCTSSDGSNCASTYSDKWFVQCKGASSKAWALCVPESESANLSFSDFETASCSANFHQDNFQCQCSSNNPAWSASLSCGSTELHGFCLTTDGSACSTDSTTNQYAFKCEGASTGAGGLVVCEDTGGSGNFSSLVHVTGTFTSNTKTVNCPSDHKAILGSAYCDDAVNLRTSCPSDSAGNCNENQEWADTSWHFACSAAPGNGIYHVVCIAE